MAKIKLDELFLIEGVFMTINSEGMGEFKASGLPSNRAGNDAANEAPFLPEDMLKEIFSSSELRHSNEVPLLNRKWMQKSIDGYNDKLRALKGFAEKLAAHLGTETGEAFKRVGAEIKLDNDKSNVLINVIFQNQVKSFSSAVKEIFKLALTPELCDELKELKAKFKSTDKPFAAFLDTAIQTQSLLSIISRYSGVDLRTTKAAVEGFIEIAGPEVAAQVLSDELKNLWIQLPTSLHEKWDKACSDTIRKALQGDCKDESRLLAAFKFFRAIDNPEHQYEDLLLLLKCNPRIAYLDKAFETLCKMQRGGYLTEERITSRIETLMEIVKDKDLLSKFIKGLEPRCYSKNEFVVLASLENCLAKKVEKNDEGEKGGRCTIS